MMVSAKKDPSAAKAQTVMVTQDKPQPEVSVVALKGLMVPMATYEAISDYVYLGRQPNQFLHAVLSNDLLGACQYANRLDTAYMRDTVLFIYNHCPRLCCGSPQRVVDWIDRCGEHFRRIRS